MTEQLEREQANDLAERLRVFAQPQRLMILVALLTGELSVASIDSITGVGQPALSQQLAELRRAGLVSQRRAARSVAYRLADDRTTSVVRFLRAMLKHDLSEWEAMTAPRPGNVPQRIVGSAAVFASVDERYADQPPRNDRHRM